MDWTAARQQQGQIDFTRRLLKLRHDYAVLHRSRFLSGVTDEELGVKDVTWINANGEEMQQAQWQDGGMHCFGMLIDGRAQTSGIHQRGANVTLLWVLNAHFDAVGFTLPQAAEVDQWNLLLDTNLDDLPQREAFKPGQQYEVTARSSLVFEAVRSSG